MSYLGDVVFLLALPRSRTAWIANWLSDHAAVLHEPIGECESLDDLERRIEAARLSRDPPARTVVVADSLAPVITEELIAHFPRCRFLCVYRPNDDVYGSLLRIDPTMKYAAFRAIVRAVDAATAIVFAIKARCHTTCTGYLDDMAHAKTVHSWVINGPAVKLDDDGTVTAVSSARKQMDCSRFATLRDMNVQMMRMKERTAAAIPRIERLLASFNNDARG